MARASKSYCGRSMVRLDRGPLGRFSLPLAYEFSKLMANPGFSTTLVSRHIRPALTHLRHDGLVSSHCISMLATCRSRVQMRVENSGTLGTARVLALTRRILHVWQALLEKPMPRYHLCASHCWPFQIFKRTDNIGMWDKGPGRGRNRSKGKRGNEEGTFEVARKVSPNKA